ncbi:MAG: hypothetical protein HZA90_25200 [Verrucomicrobia bacterium]|nr:hypothetical protein [Verrucomicrobiota bacterium]
MFVLCWGVLAAASVAASAPDLSEKEQTAARKLYVAKCAKCHRFYEPTNYTEPNWQAWMGKMSRKSKLKPEQENLLTRFLNAYRAGQVSAPR